MVCVENYVHLISIGSSFIIHAYDFSFHYWITDTGCEFCACVQAQRTLPYLLEYLILLRHWMLAGRRFYPDLQRNSEYSIYVTHIFASTLVTTQHPNYHYLNFIVGRLCDGNQHKGRAYKHRQNRCRPLRRYQWY